MEDHGSSWSIIKCHENMVDHSQDFAWAIQHLTPPMQYEIRNECGDVSTAAYFAPVSGKQWQLA